MEEKRLPVIAINREYGAGGRALAAILSERLGIPYYDRDFVQKTIEESGYEKEDVEREGEEMSKSARVFNNILNSAVSYKSSHDEIYKAEKKVILELAKSPCIMVGRSADHILNEAGIDTVSVYLHGPVDLSVKRARELGENGNMTPEKFVEEHDRKRRTFYRQYTGRELFDAANYTFCFDVGKVSVPECAEIILDMIKREGQKDE